MEFEFDNETAHEAGTQLTLDVKRRIMGLNAAKLYGVDVPAEFQSQRLSSERVAPAHISEGGEPRPRRSAPACAEVRAAIAAVRDPEIDETL